jgi:hypothetical protein
MRPNEFSITSKTEVPPVNDASQKSYIRGCQVLYKGLSSEKHFSPLERQKCFPDIQPLALATDLLLPVVSCCLHDSAISLP